MEHMPSMCKKLKQKNKLQHLFPKNWEIYDSFFSVLWAFNYFFLAFFLLKSLVNFGKKYRCFENPQATIELDDPEVFPGS